jgi:hypothetical protein
VTASAKVDGDLHHMSLLIEQGAIFEGRSRRAKGEQDLIAVVEGTGHQQPARGGEAGTEALPREPMRRVVRVRRAECSAWAG